MDVVAPDSLSALIGEIYDCALGPDRWPVAMQRICETLDCVTGRLFVADMAAGSLRFGSSWNEPPGAVEVLGNQFGGQVTAAMRAALSDPDHDADMPFVLSRSPGGLDFLNSQVTHEWATPLGWCDAMNSVVLREGPRVGVFSAVRHRDVGIATDREVAILRLLAPHLRRAVTIGDLLDMQALEAEALRGAMDGLAVGIGVVDAEGTILHANAAAQEMFADDDGPIRAAGGRIAGRRSEATAELHAAIATAADSESRLGTRGLGVALGGARSADAPALAHVLPLTGSRTRRGLHPRAAAAVFVTPPRRGQAPGQLDALARSLGLTAAEARLLERLAAGETLAEARGALGIAETTAKTHLARIFGKAGVARQAELMSLVERLAPPLRAG